MAKSYNVSFNILGNLDPSLLAAIKNAQSNIAALGRLNGKAIANAQKLTAANKKLADITAYKDLRRSIEAANKARAQEVINISRANAQLQRQKANLGDMRKAYRELQKTQERLKAEARTQRESVDVARAGLKNAKSSGDVGAIQAAQAALRAQMESARRAAQAVKEINAAIRQGNAEIKAQQATIRGLNSSFAQSSDRARQFSQQLATQRAELANLRGRVNVGNLGNEEMRLQSSIRETTNALNQEIAALERRNQILNNFSQRQQDLANAYSNIQNSIDTAKNIMSPFTGAIDKAVEFEHTMSTLRSISQMDLIKAGNVAQAEENMRRLTAQAKELGATTIYTAQQVGEAQVYIARTGWDTDKIEKSMPSILKLAAANRMGVERTADIVTNVMTAFGHGVDQVEHDTDVFAYTVTHSNQTFEQFGEAMKYAAPVAKLFGTSIEEAAMMTKFMVDAGVQGSMAGTAMRQTMLRLTAPTKKAQKMFAEMGITASDARKEQMEAAQAAAAYGVVLDNNLSPARKFISVMEQLDKGLAGQSDQEKLAALKDIVGIYAVSGAANLFGAGATQAKNFTELLENCRGALNQTYDEMTADTFGAQKSFESAWEAIQLSVGDSLLGFAQTGYEIAAPKMASLSQFIDEHQELVQAAFAIATAVAVATVAVAGFSLAMAGVRFAQAGFATASLLFADLTTKITAARAALAGLTMANIGASLSSGLTAASAAARAFGSSMLVASRAALAFMFTPVGAILMAIALAALYAAQNWDRVAPALSAIGNIVSGILLPAFERVKAALSNLFDIDLSGLTLLNGIGSGLVATFIVLGGVAVTVLSTIAAAIADVIKLVVDLVNNILKVGKAIANLDFSKAFDGLKTLVTDFGSDFADIGLNIGRNIYKGVTGTSAAFETYLHPQVTQTVENAQSAQAEQLNVAPLQTAVDTTGQALGQMSLPAQETGASLGLISMPAQELAASMPLVPPELNNMTMAAQTTSPELANMGTSAQVATPAVDVLGTSSQGAGNYVQAMGGVALSASVHIAALSGAASAVAGALQAKAAEIGSIHIPKPQLQVVTVTQTVAAKESNAEGGIYQKGAFVTSFAEDSAEAAIPLDRSPRAISLWQQAGQMLGMQPTYSEPNFNVVIHVTINGNADAKDVRRGIEQALPAARRSFEEDYYRFQHEQKRRSFA